MFSAKNNFKKLPEKQKKAPGFCRGLSFGGNQINDQIKKLYVAG